MRSIASVLAILIFAFVQGPLLFAADWPHWRGPDRNGISKETGWSEQFPEDGPQIAWKAKVGLGFSSFVVSGGRVVTLGHADEQDTVFCFDAVSGEEIWKHSYPAELGDKYFDGGTTGTPTFDGDHVFVLSRWGDVFCFSAADGKIVWSKNVQEETGARLPDWGFGGAPLVLGERVYLNMGAAGVALDRKTGVIVWQSEPSAAAGYSTPLPINGAGEDLAVFSSGQAYVGVNLRDGKPVWSVRWLTQYGVNAADPIIEGNQLFLSTGYSKGSALFDMGGENPKELWKSKALATQMNAAVLFQGDLYGVHGDTTGRAALKCIEFATGKERWSHANFGSGGVIIVDGRLMGLSGTGELIIASATPEGFDPVAQAQILGGKTWTAPVMAHGFIYCRNSRGDVVVVDVRK